jgi:hypothetical protein
MAAVTADTSRAADPGSGGPVPARTAGPAAADRSSAAVRPGRAVRSWPLLVLAVPAAAEVWSGWAGIAQKTGFGLVSPLPGVWPSLHLDTAITLPVGVEAYAAYALRAWLSREQAVSARTRRFAKWSAIFSFALGMAGQTSDAVKLSSCLGKFFLGGGEGGGLVVVLPGDQAVPEAAEQAAEQVALGGGVPVAGVFAAVVVGSGAG